MAYFLKISCLFFLAALGRHCCVRAFSSCGEWGYSLGWRAGFSLWRLLLLQRTGSRLHRLSNCGSWA